MRAWEVQGEWGIDHLQMVDRPAPTAAAGQVVVRLRAASINYRDLLTVQGMGGTRRLPALVGLAHARRLLFSGAIVDAAEALRIGLVDRVVPDDQVDAAVADLLAPILAAAPEAVKQTKAALRIWSHGATEEQLANFDREAQAILFEHPDKFARMDAFLAKRRAKG